MFVACQPPHPGRLARNPVTASATEEHEVYRLCRYKKKSTLVPQFCRYIHNVKVCFQERIIIIYYKEELLLLSLLFLIIKEELIYINYNKELGCIFLL